MRAPDVELGAAGETDAEVTAAVIARLYPVLASLRPEAAVFLGDTNTVMGAVAAAQLGIPIVHIEGCMRSYDWRMPEEKYRTAVDHLSDVIYTYFDEYKRQGIAEGLAPGRMVVVQNLIVDVLERHYFARKDEYDALASDAFFRERGLKRGEYHVMTCHRRENVDAREPLEAILALAGAAKGAVYFAAGYRTQRQIAAFGLAVPSNVVVVDPIGYREILALMVNARGVITDSGTLVEEACVLQVPSVQCRRSTERPQVYDAGASVKFDPTRPAEYPPAEVLRKLDALRGRRWAHGLGDGKASARIVADLVSRMERPDGFRTHRPEDYPLDVSRSYRGDGLA